MKNSAVLAHSRGMLSVALALAFCVLAGCSLTVNVDTAHALFTSDAHIEFSHKLKAFPTGLSAQPNNYVARSSTIDRSKLKVTVTYSDGTSRVLGNNEYALSSSSFPSGHKGAFANNATYTDGEHCVSAPFTLVANEAYGAQYGDTLVFGRGIPAATYNGKSLSNTTWGIESSGCTPLWNKSTLANIVDIDTVKPVTLKNWFNQSTSLKSIVLDQMDTSSITDMSEVFYKDTALTTLDVSKWNVSNVTTIFRMFSWCESLVSLDLSAWKTSSLTTTELAFNRSYELTTTGNLKGWDVSKVTTFHNTFDLCYKLKTIGDVSGWNTSKVTDMDCMFANCYVLTVNCSGWNVSKVTDHFDFCRNAPGVKPPSSLWT